MVRLSAVMNVYNEELCLPCCLDSLLPVLDELIIVDGSEDGSSDDGTLAIIERFSSEYPNKIQYFSGTFARHDGSWDCASQWNLGFGKITGDFVMCTAADIIYDYEDAIMARNIAEQFRRKKYFYAPWLEFFLDTKHIILQDSMTKEPRLPRPLCVHPVWLATSLGVYCVDDNNKETFATCEEIDWNRDLVFMPHVKRFHFGHIKPFRYQVVKAVKYVRRGEHAEIDADAGEDAIYEYAIDFAKKFTGASHAPYTGIYPRSAEPIRNITAMDGYEEFMEKFNAENAIC
jgi:glycosyltransferase involved in cell wall biosynthesis